MSEYALTLDAWGTLFGSSDSPEPGLVDAVLGLPPALPMAIITNTGSKGRLMVETMLAEWGISHRFKGVVASGEVGFAKPHRVPFEQAARLLGVEPGRLIHLGDSPSGDVGGVQGVGGIGLHYAPRGYPCDHADAVITHYDELILTLSRWIESLRA